VLTRTLLRSLDSIFHNWFQLFLMTCKWLCRQQNLTLQYWHRFSILRTEISCKSKKESMRSMILVIFLFEFFSFFAFFSSNANSIDRLFMNSFIYLRVWDDKWSFFMTFNNCLIKTQSYVFLTSRKTHVVLFFLLMTV
jgi:hypothetical protein